MPFLTVHDCPVRYDRTGNGPTVVLLHGGGLDSARLSWAPLTPHLVPLADVIAPDGLWFESTYVPILIATAAHPELFAGVCDAMTDVVLNKYAT